MEGVEPGEVFAVVLGEVRITLYLMLDHWIAGIKQHGNAAAWTWEGVLAWNKENKIANGQHKGKEQ